MIKVICVVHDTVPQGEISNVRMLAMMRASGRYHHTPMVCPLHGLGLALWHGTVWPVRINNSTALL